MNDADRTNQAGLAISRLGSGGKVSIYSSAATDVIVDVTAARPAGPGYLSVYPTGTSSPDTSVVNHTTGQTVANSVIAKVGAGGRVEVYRSVGSDVVVDVQGSVGG